jgi:hypothetical protein
MKAEGLLTQACGPYAHRLAPGRRMSRAQERPDSFSPPLCLTSPDTSHALTPCASIGYDTCTGGE